MIPTHINMSIEDYFQFRVVEESNMAWVMDCVVKRYLRRLGLNISFTRDISTPEGPYMKCEKDVKDFFLIWPGYTDCCQDTDVSLLTIKFWALVCVFSWMETNARSDSLK